MQEHNTELLRFTTAGSVDDGKSTLIGRLLYDSKSIFQDQYDQIKETSERRGEEGVNLALLTDGLKSEREQGITIDVAYRYFSTPKRKFIIADTPGHIQYTRNMVTGASTANVALVLIDARNGVVEQTRRHAIIASLLQIPHLVVCINKMDLVDYSEERYNEIQDEFEAFAAKLNVKDVHFVPISALVGDNVVNRSEKTPWYEGPTLMYYLENVHISSDHNYIDARFPVQFVIRPYSDEFHDFRGYAGRVAGGVMKVGDEVKAGDVLFHAKKDTTVKYVSPVSGEVVEIRRGEKRAISDIIIMADKEIKHKQFDPPSIAEGSRAEIVDFLCESGGWTLFNERPQDVLPSVDSLPKNIFISTFDSAPLAPDLNYVVDGKEEAFQKGLDTLGRLTEGAVCLGLDARGETAPHVAFTNAQGVEKTFFGGAHPSGNVGVQIHHTHPINTGDKVWTLTVQEVITLGQLMYKGIWDASRVVAITGAQVSKAQYASTYVGAQIGELLQNNLTETKLRIIDGDVLSGKHVHNDEFLSFRSDQVSVIEEGDYYEMLGWLLPLKPRPTISKTFPNFLFKTLKFDGDTNTHGEQRAFVVTGQYEQVLPMNIYPQHLMKAIMVGDIEQMEGYGINELSEEDIALCEFTCTSKQPLQSILRDGLDMLREQG